jgi:hypothetical protein
MEQQNFHEESEKARRLYDIAMFELINNGSYSSFATLSEAKRIHMDIGRGMPTEVESLYKTALRCCVEDCQSNAEMSIPINPPEALEYALDAIHYCSLLGEGVPKKLEAIAANAAVAFAHFECQGVRECGENYIGHTLARA